LCPLISNLNGFIILPAAHTIASPLTMCPEPHVIFIVATQAEFDLHAPPSNRNLFIIAHLTGQDARCQPKVTLRSPRVPSATLVDGQPMTLGNMRGLNPLCLRMC
jgi:hypothetical protein